MSARRTVVALLCLGACVAAASASTPPRTPTHASIAQTIAPLMARYGIPGMAVGITLNGHARVFDFGLASKAPDAPVDSRTLFEIGSVSKTFTATLAAYARVNGKLRLSDIASADDPSLRGSAFDRVTLLNLATYTAGGLPLQVPSDIATDAQLLAYFRHWKPRYSPGTERLYSNVSIGLLGTIVARRLNNDFASLVLRDIFGPLQLRHSYYVIPAAQQSHYAQGYTRSGKPIRLVEGPLAAPTYGVRTTATDLLRFLQANLATSPRGALQRAIAATHMGYYRAGPIVQGIVWEQLPCPVTRARLRAANSDQLLFDPNSARAIMPPQAPPTDALFDKTGSTNGFSTYVAFVPQTDAAIVILANKSYPMKARIDAAYTILAELGALPRCHRY